MKYSGAMVYQIRPAKPADIPDIVRLVRDLAEYEKARDQVVATEEDFHQALFPQGVNPTTFAHVVDNDTASGRRVVGIAIWYVTFSTWTGSNGIWLEDLYVEPECRGTGIGRALLKSLGAECMRRGYPRLEFWVLDWNKPSIEFYKSLGARGEDEWTVYRFDGEALVALGS